MPLGALLVGHSVSTTLFMGKQHQNPVSLPLGIIGGLVLPVLGALPDTLIVVFSGMGSREQAQEQVRDCACFSSPRFAHSVVPLHPRSFWQLLSQQAARQSDGC
jgi:hypothetical protein